jgi:hypothetical protein
VVARISAGILSRPPMFVEQRLSKHYNALTWYIHHRFGDYPP